MRMQFDNTATSPEDCQILCKSKENCLSFVYMGSSLCYLLSANYTVDQEEVVVDVMSVSGPKECPEDLDILTTWFNGPFPGREDLADPNLDDIREAASSTLTAGACAEKCETTAGCESWSFDSYLRELNCRLFRDRPAISVAVNATTTASTRRRRSLGKQTTSSIKSGYKRIVPFIKSNFMFVGEPLAEYDTQGLESCRSFCVATEGCEYWSILEDADAASKCTLFNYTVRNGLNENESATSGTRQKPGLQSAGYKYVIEPEMGTADQQEVNSSEDCRAKCEAMHNCLAFNYNSAAGTCHAIAAKTTDKAVALTLETEEGTLSSLRVSQAVQLVKISQNESVE